MTRHATISGVGSALPPRLVPNTWFESSLDTTDEWIRDRTGIKARHFVDDRVVTSDLAVQAIQAALEVARMSPDQIDLLICATITGDVSFPATAVLAQEKLGIGCPAFDVGAACAGFSYGLATATAFIQAGMAETVLLVGAEVFSKILNYTDRGTCVLFGDGAGAVVVTASDSPGVEGTVLGADGSAAGILMMPTGGKLEMSNGREVFKRAVTEMAASCRDLLDKSGYTADDVDILIPHQANARIMAAVGDRLGIGPDRAIMDVADVGNTSAASIPIALDRAWRAGRIHEGNLVLFTSFGAGLTWGASLLRWTMPEPPS